ncbi:TolC family protein [Flavobacteriaceae bacterium TP-CH-4]|uniref:TolC family protein n=1 Tax=Pelagihabitans pacificus TaxID=2696054 RepID=A0A967E6V7_9FLAO|nr:TolC family protein [Pelagihabitans pacificus]NHF59569.1 TolC family protein [Pelagihabitans pacificus]
MESNRIANTNPCISFYLLLLLALFGHIGNMRAQYASLGLEEAYGLARTNYPLIKDGPLLENIAEINLQVLNRKRLPTVDLVGLGQVQSENVQIGTEDPNSPISVSVPLESYRSYLDINYNLFDGGLTRASKKAETTQLKVNQQALQVNLRNLKDQVNTLFLNILLLQQQKDLLAISKEDIVTNISLLQAGYDNGTVLESELAKLQVRKIELESEEISLQGDIDAFLEVLSKLLGAVVTNNTLLTLPEPIFQEQAALAITRPEQKLFEYQRELLEIQKRKFDADRLPKLSLFAQGGVGYPNPLNFADISTSTYGLGGVRLNWNIVDWGVSKKEKKKIDLQKQQIAVDKEVFEFDIQKSERESLQKLNALNAQIEKDRQIVALQSEILKQTAVQLQEGVINSNDYVMQVNAELSARQQLELHLVQKQKLQIEYLTLFGKL